jgi:protoporphyrinogen oxidase
MPVKELIAGMGDAVPPEVQRAAAGLIYRDFMTVGLLLNGLKVKNRSGIPTVNNIIPDNWIYVQERDVRVGRLQIFNNWSPYMVKDPKAVWVGLEYFHSEADDLWRMTDDQIKALAVDEMVQLDLIERSAVLDSTVIRMPKAYPAYFGTYDRFDAVRKFTDGIENLFLIGRNGMHRYNNSDHSMLTAMTAVEHWLTGRTDKSAIWEVNTEQEYHESKPQAGLAWKSSCGSAQNG